MKKFIKKALFNISVEMADHPARFTFIIGAILAIVIAIFDIYDCEFSRHDILVEAHGLIFDLLLVGVIFAFYESFKEKIGRIRQYQEEIYDFRDWHSEEAMHRISGIIRRLNEDGVSRINLFRCGLTNAKLRFVKLTGSHLHKTEFIKADLESAKLNNTNMSYANFSEANLKYAHLDHSDLMNANFSNADLSNADLESCLCCDSIFLDADLTNTYFKLSDLTGAKLDGAKVVDINWFDELKRQQCVGIPDLELRYEVNGSGIVVLKTP
jgi:hypothetical protein